MLKFPREIIKTAKSTDEAISLALAELNASELDVNIDVLDEGNKGFLGLGSKEATVKLTLKDANAFIAKSFLNSIFKSMKLEVEIDAKSEDDTLNIELSGDHMGVVIGKRGDTLDSIQYLTSLVVNHENEDYVKVVIDTENYREKRLASLLKLASRLAHKVARTGKKYTLEPMNPYERRIIHSSLQDSEDVTTFSIGEDPHRKVVISPKNPAPRKKSRPSSSASAIDYAASYSDYKKTAPSQNVIKKAENFEAYQAALEAENGGKDENLE